MCGRGHGGRAAGDVGREDDSCMREGTAVIRSAIKLNQAWSAALERRLPQAKADPLVMYDHAVVRCASKFDAPVIVDVGGGKHCTFASLVDKSKRAKIIAVDVSEEELRHNTDVDEKRVADAAKGLPFADGEVDLIASRLVLEHVADVEAFIAHSARVLRSGGYAVHLMPGRFAPFAVVARVMPFNLAKRIVHFLRPQTIGVIEFPVYYDKCYYSALHDTFARNGYTGIQITPFYYSSDYYDAFFPAYCVSALYEMTIRWLRLRNLAGYVLVVARR